MMIELNDGQRMWMLWKVAEIDIQIKAKFCQQKNDCFV